MPLTILIPILPLDNFVLSLHTMSFEQFFTSTEFYVIAFTLGIALLAALTSGRQRSEVITYFFVARLAEHSGSDEPSLRVEAAADGRLLVVHRGILLSEGVVPAIALDISDSDMRIKEKTERRTDGPLRAYDATYIIDVARCQRYHLLFESTVSGRYASTSLRNEMPFHVEVPMHF